MKNLPTAPAGLLLTAGMEGVTASAQDKPRGGMLETCEGIL